MDQFDKALFVKYKQHCVKKGLSVNTKSQARGLLLFEDTTDTNSGAITPIFVCTPSSSLSLMLTPVLSC